MMRRLVLGSLLLGAPASVLLAADAANLTGTWHLNVEKSKWGRKPKPQSAEVTVEHAEPRLHYKGTVVTGLNGESRSFEFTGAIDGKEYPFGDGKITVKRVDARTTAAEYKSSDGRTVDRTRTTISEDGRTLTRQISSRGPQGNLSWTEVYEKR
jgi:hypothetical protein